MEEAVTSHTTPVHEAEQAEARARIEASRVHWIDLARDADDMAKYLESRGEYGGAYRNKAEMYRRTARALALELETGTGKTSMIRPVRDCGYVEPLDGTCTHRRNITPECHTAACPLVTDFRGHVLARLDVLGSYVCGEESSDGWTCNKVRGHEGAHVAACTSEVDETEHYDEIVKEWDHAVD